MQESKKALKKMALWASVIVLCDIIRIAEIVWMPTQRGLVSIFYLPVMAIYLIHSYRTRIVERDGLKLCLLCVAWLILVFVCVREIKYNAFGNDWYGRYLWYLYYVPAILMPLCTFFVAIMINTKDKLRLPGRWSLLVIPALLLIFLILTNDFHQQVFRFQEEFYEWNTDYSRGWGFYVIWIWQFGLYLAALIVMIRSCRLTIPKKAALVPLFPLVVAAILMIAANMGYEMRFHGILLLGFPEIMVFSVAFFWEGCIQIGLVPVIDNYDKLMSKLSLPVWITSKEGRVIYHSDAGKELSPEYLQADGTTFLDRNTLLHGYKIQGGYGLWVEDLTEINQTQNKLKKLKEKLEEESALIALENKRKEEQARIDKQNELYDHIANMTRKQSIVINRLAARTERLTEENLRVKNAELICFYGSYMKRISNLMLLENADSRMSTGELFLAIAESFHYLEMTGVVCAIGDHPDTVCAASSLVMAYVMFESLIEKNLNSLKGIFAALQAEGSSVYLRLNLEGVIRKSEEEIRNYALDHQVPLYCELDDDEMYIRIKL